MSLDLNCYGMIGDMRTCALVSDKGSIDWMCMPRFDSSAILLRLLDDERGGCCDIELVDFTRSERRYLPGTNILETLLVSEAGVLRVRDFFSLRQNETSATDSAADGQCLRLMECISGTIDFQVAFRPTFGFATCSHRVAAGDHVHLYEAEVDGLTSRLSIQWSSELHDLRQGHWHAQLSTGGRCWFSIQNLDSLAEPTALSDADVEQRFRLTRQFWEQWSSRCTYRGRWQDAVLRSILSLKLLTYAPTGAIAAAATCGLPEVIGGVRNWDYRFCWLRDASFTVSSFLNCGYRHEARRFLDFIADKDPSFGTNLQILYPLAGSAVQERSLDHLSGWKGSRPVRTGNKASEQVQLDIYGEYLSALAMYIEDASATEIEELRDRLEKTVQNILHFVEIHWTDADQGLWEMQTPAEQYLHSKGMCAVAIDRALKLDEKIGLALSRERWITLHNEIQEDYLNKAWSAQNGALMQTYSLSNLDASAMRLALYGALNVGQAKTKATIETIARQLTAEDLVYRYHGEDGLPGQEGCFTVCSFWLASMYALQGETDRAAGLFERMLTRSNDLGLFSEEMLPGTYEQIGNFPQAFTHMGVINNGLRIEKLLNAPQG